MRGLAILACCFLLASCVLASTKMLDERTAVISAQGGVEHSMADVQAKVFQEAAKLCQVHGYRYFQILGAADASRSGAIVIPGQTYASGSVTAVGNTATFQTSSYSSPGSAFGFIKPGADVTIRMFRESEVPAGGPGLWDSQSVLAAQAKT